MRFTTIDCVIVVLYLIEVAVFGIISGAKRTGTGDHFLGSKRNPWRLIKKESSHYFLTFF